MARRERDKRYRDENKETISAYQRGYRRKKGDELKEKKKAYKAENRDRIASKEKEKRKKRTPGQRAADVAKSKKWHEANKARSIEKAREWHENNPERVREVKRRHKKKKLTTPKGKLEAHVSRALRRGLIVGSKAGRRTFDLLGYSAEDLRQHLERIFLPGMSWVNYGRWHIDHIVPLAAHNYETPDDIDFKRAWALENLQPLWASDNHSKGARLYKPFQPSLALAETI